MTRIEPAGDWSAPRTEWAVCTQRFRDELEKFVAPMRRICREAAERAAKEVPAGRYLG